MPIEKIWRVANTYPELEKDLAEELEISALLARLLINRGIKEISSARTFLFPELIHLHDPFLLNDMHLAVKRIWHAVSRNEKILIYGDYDVDGITGVTLLFSFLKKQNSQVSYYIPHRVNEGYCLNKKAVQRASLENVKLIITVDCGITAGKEIDYARQKGIDVVVTDHHKPGEKIPPATAVINPGRKDSGYPFHELAGVGVVFKLVQAMSTEHNGKVTPSPLPEEIRQYLDLVALGTIADVVPLKGENRILVKYGLQELSQTQRPGLQAILEKNKIYGKQLTSTQVGFIIAPRLNASGRLGEAERGVKLLLAESKEEALPLVQILDKENRKRQQIGNQAVEESLSRIKEEIDLNSDKVIVLADESWHPGVIGIAASRLVEKFNRPVILITLDKEQGKGSARSIESFHLFQALKECQDLFINLGGHSQAAGLTIARDKIKHLRKRMNTIACAQLNKEDFIPKLKIDSPLSLKDISLELIESLERLSPFGKNNPKPLFSSTRVELLGSPFLVKNNHLKLRVTEGGPVREAIGFRMGDKLPQPNQEISSTDLAYSLEINEWNGAKTIQLHLHDIKFA